MAVIDRLNGLGPIESNSIGSSMRVNDKASSETGAFQLPVDDTDGVVYEPSAATRNTHKTLSQVKEEVAKEEAEAAKNNLHARFDGPGVAVELSKSAVKAAKEAKPKSILEIFADTWNSFRNLILSFWNGGDNAQSVEDVAEETIESEIPKSDTVYSGNSLTNDAESIASFMVDYGGRHLVKNSDLLTQYDRSGRITGPTPSDRRRILQGEGKVSKY